MQLKDIACINWLKQSGSLGSLELFFFFWGRDTDLCKLSLCVISSAELSRTRLVTGLPEHNPNAPWQPLRSITMNDLIVPPAAAMQIGHHCAFACGFPKKVS